MLAKVCISGLSAVGKTFVSKSVTRIIDAKRLSASTILLDYGLALGYESFYPSDRKQHFWFDQKAIRFSAQRLADTRLDRMVDQLLLSYAEKSKRVVFDSLSIPALWPQTNPCFSVLLVANPEIRTARAWVSSDNIPLDEIKEGLAVKDKTTRNILLNSWGFDILSQDYLDRFDLVIDNSSFDDIANIRRFEKQSKQKTLDIISTAISLYRIAIGDNEKQTKREGELLRYFQELVYHYPAVILRVPKQFIGTIKNFNSTRWEVREHVWLKNCDSHKMG
ncbi:MAG: hypothetical protein Q7K40_00030 [bacterium]|nr:hypothetical protein [bacterium]